jgi:hypothetical protein
MNMLPGIMGSLLIVAGIGQIYLRILLTARMNETKQNRSNPGRPELQLPLRRQPPSLYIIALTRWEFHTNNPGIIMIIIGAFLLGLTPFLPHISN